jgi:hypothetical protein
MHGEIPLLTLMDGTLIMWMLEAETDPVRAELMRDLELLLDAARSRRAPIAGYISRPGSRDVVNLVRAWMCGFDEALCGLRCNSMNGLRAGAECEAMTELSDRVLFGRMLRPGERSAVFGSRSRILNDLTPHHRIVFFYLHVGSEVVRVEIPMWVMDEDGLLDTIHALVFDQAAKGAGYPRALTEAHECAVVRGQERALMFRILEKELIQGHVRVEITRKALAKRTRSV